MIFNVGRVPVLSNPLAVSCASISGPRFLPSILSATATSAHEPRSPLFKSGKTSAAFSGSFLPGNK